MASLNPNRRVPFGSMDPRRSAIILLILGTLVAPSLCCSDHEAPDDDCVVGSKAYVLALLTHDPTPVPLHPHCIRTENGIVTGVSGPNIAFILAHGPQYLIIERIQNETYVAEEGIVISNYVLQLNVSGVHATDSVVENFTCKIDNGVEKLWRINAVFSLPAISLP